MNMKKNVVTDDEIKGVFYWGICVGVLGCLCFNLLIMFLRVHFFLNSNTSIGNTIINLP